jgi:Phosphotransferase enzyme family
VYAFGRRLPRLVQSGIALQIRLPGIRRLFAERCPQVEPACGWEVWDLIVERLSQGGAGTARNWLYIRSLWDKPRSSAIGLDAQGEPQFFLTIDTFHNSSRRPLLPVSSFRVPACTASFRVGDWAVRQHELLPQYHRPAGWNPERIRRVAADVCLALADALEKPADTPSHWRPMHGDLVPWNLREDNRGRLWLMDWEDAAWGPPLGDLVRFMVAYESLARSNPAWIAAHVRKILVTESAEAVQEAGRFWMHHRNLQPALKGQGWPPQMAKDRERGAREFAAFRSLASGE